MYTYVCEVLFWLFVITFQLMYEHIIDVYRYIGSAKYWLSIWQNFQYQQLKLYRYLHTNVILFSALFSCNHFYCVDNHFTSFVVIGYGLQ